MALLLPLPAGTVSSESHIAAVWSLLGHDDKGLHDREAVGARYAAQDSAKQRRWIAAVNAIRAALASDARLTVVRRKKESGAEYFSAPLFSTSPDPA
jgi:hypothetical protein